MTKKTTRQKNASRKRGSDSNEKAVKHRKTATNFKQSRDIHEDRSTVQSKFHHKKGK